MAGDRRFQIEARHLPVADDLAAVDDQMLHPRRTRKKKRGGIPASCALNAAHVPQGDICTLAHGDPPAIGAAEHIGAVARGDLERLAGAHRIGPFGNPL